MALHLPQLSRGGVDSALSSASDITTSRISSGSVTKKPSADLSSVLSSSSSPRFPPSRSRTSKESRSSAKARNAVVSMASVGIKTGHLTIRSSDGSYAYHFGSPLSDKQSDGGRVVDVEVHDERFWSMILLNGDLGFSEAYITSIISISPTPASIIHMWFDNKSTLADSLQGTFGQLISRLFAVLSAYLGQTVSRSKIDVGGSYDTSNALYQCFLSNEMQYSCALWGDEEGGVDGDLAPTTNRDISGDLEAAQERKLHRILNASGLIQTTTGPRKRLLEFGSGWGSLAIMAAQKYNCTVDTLTLSASQKSLAESRIRALGLQDYITVHLLDYRDFPKVFPRRKASYDNVVSIEMVEHVGPKNYKKYFEIINWALSSSPSSKAVITSSTFPEQNYSTYQRKDFVRKYIWPNGTIPSPTSLIEACKKGSKSRLALSLVENHSAHYPRTLRTWSRSLGSNLPAYKSAILADLPPHFRTNEAEWNAFVRKWEYLFVYAATGFERGYLGCHMLVWSRAC